MGSVLLHDRSDFFAAQGVGIILTLFYNLPFELISLRISDFLLALAAILSVISGVKYYIMAKPYLKDR